MTVKITKNTVTLSITRIQRDLGVLPQQAFDFWVKTTPIRSGNARRRTRLRGNVIDANYPYAVPLDQGSSSQAPQGMTGPTEKFIQQQLRRTIRK